MVDDTFALVLAGDCLELLPTLAADSIDAVVTDPLYHLTSIVKRFGSVDAAPAKSNGATGVYARASAGFMGQRWDGGDIAFRPETWAAVARVMKPGAHLLAFGGTRTYHRLACAIEEAGFEIRDAIMWHYASGFPKSHDVSKAIDRAAGAEREVVGLKKLNPRDSKSYVPKAPGGYGGTQSSPLAGIQETAPATDAARQWAGWGTALKPATEIIALARKPLSEPTVATNVLRWGTGALNIDASRVGYANEADADDRRGASHPTVKPVALLRWLVRLITPPGGLVLDPFAGTGTTLEAALIESCRAIGIERDQSYAREIERRLGHTRRRHAAVRGGG